MTAPEDVVVLFLRAGDSLPMGDVDYATQHWNSRATAAMRRSESFQPRTTDDQSTTVVQNPCYPTSDNGRLWYSRRLYNGAAVLGSSVARQYLTGREGALREAALCVSHSTMS
jgi:hypothetical protein